MKEYIPNKDITELNSDDIPPGTTRIHINDNTSLKTLSNLPAGLEVLCLYDCTSLIKIENLPPNLQRLTLARCTSLTTLPNLPAGLKGLYLYSCTSLTTLPNLPPNLKLFDLSGFTSLTTLPNLPLNLEELYLSECNSLTTLPNLPLNLQKLDLSECTSLTTLPNLPPNLEMLDLSGCTSLTTLPNLPPNLEELYLSECTSLQNTPALIAQLEELETAMRDNSDFILIWPDHLDRSPQITKIKQDIISAYRQFYQDDPSFKNKSPNISDQANYPVLSLMHRFMSESLAYRGGVKKVVKSILPITEQISKNPSILEYINPIAQNYLAACVNQPVAGFVIIANIVEIDKQTSLQEKIDQSKFLFLVNKINEECVKLASKLQVGQGVEVEFANAMLKKVNDKLIASGDISKPIPGTPDGISYEDTVKSFLSDDNIETIYNEVKSALSELTREKISENITNSEYQLFWASQSLGDDVMAKYKQDIRSLKEKYVNDQGEGLMSDEDFNKQILQITSKIIEESKNKTLSFLKEEEESRIKRRRLDEIENKIFGISTMKLDPRLVKKPPELDNIDYRSDNESDKSDDESTAQYNNEFDSDDEKEERSDSGIQMTEVSSLSGLKRVRDPRQ